MNLSFATFTILIITPGPFAFLLIPGIYLAIKAFHEFMESGDGFRLVLVMITPIVLAGISFIEFQSTSSRLGWRQILAPGGVHRPHLVLSFFIALTFLAYLFRSHLNNVTTLIVISGGLSVALLSGLTLLFTGNIQYYAVKQFYVWAPICVLFILREMIVNYYEGKKTLPIIMAVSMLLTLIVSITSSFQSQIGFMGTPFSALRNIMNVEVWDKSIVYSKTFTSKNSFETYEHQKCIINRLNPNESDLNSRWANALSKPITMSENCFGGYWNSSSLTTVQLLNRLKMIDEKFLVLIRAEDRPKNENLPIYSNIEIEFR